MSEIKFKVRYSALLLKDFTVSEIIRVTALNPESVRTEIQRMRKEGLIISTPHPEKQKKRGGRPSIYHLPDDPEKLLELSKSVEVFYPPMSSNDAPSSRFYKSAKELIDQALTSEDFSNNELLSDAESDLDMAEQAEGGILASQLVKAHLEYERARIMYLSGNHEQVLEVFKDLRKYFENNRIEYMVKQIDEYILCLTASISFIRGAPGKYGNAEWARCLISTLKENNFRTESPLIVLFLRLLRDLSIMGIDELVNDIAVKLEKTTSQRAEMRLVENLFQNQSIQMLLEQNSSLKSDEAPKTVESLLTRPNKNEIN